VAYLPDHHEDDDDYYLLFDVFLTLFSLQDHSFVIVSILLFLGYRQHLYTSLMLSDKLTAPYT
jgi:hypothetical protein